MSTRSAVARTAENKKKRDSLINGCDVHWYTTREGYDHIMRTMFDQGIKTLSAVHRAMWFPKGWEKRHAEQMKRHRKAGIPDANFAHPKFK